MQLITFCVFQRQPHANEMPYYVVARHTQLLRPFNPDDVRPQPVSEDVEDLKKARATPAPRVSAIVMYNGGSKNICQLTVDSILDKTGISGQTIDNLPNEGDARVILFVMFLTSPRIMDEYVVQPYKAWLQNQKNVIVLALRRGLSLQAMSPNPHITGAAKILEFRFMKTLYECDTNTSSLAELKDCLQ